jgi:hypothetical protein
MANPDIGFVACPQCGTDAPVRWQKGVPGTKKYYACKRCGQFFPRLDGGQAWIDANMRPIDSDANAVTDPEPEKDREPSFFEMIFGGDDD